MEEYLIISEITDETTTSGPEEEPTASGDAEPRVEGLSSRSAGCKSEPNDTDSSSNETDEGTVHSDAKTGDGSSVESLSSTLSDDEVKLPLLQVDDTYRLIPKLEPTASGDAEPMVEGLSSRSAGCKSESNDTDSSSNETDEGTVDSTGDGSSVESVSSTLSDDEVKLPLLQVDDTYRLIPKLEPTPSVDAEPMVEGLSSRSAGCKSESNDTDSSSNETDEGTVDSTGDGSSVESVSSTLSDDEVKLPLLQVDDSYRLIPKLDLTMPIDETRMSQPERPSVMEQVVNVLQEGSKWDVEVHVGHRKFYCNMCVLQAYSPYFVEDTYVFRLPSEKVTARSFRIIYKWMLHDPASQRRRFSKRCLMEVYSTAKCLGIAELVDAIWDLMDTNKNENEVFTMLPNKKNPDLATFEFLCFSRISRFFLTLVASLEFVEIDLETVCQLLSSHSLGVNSETEIFYSAVRWLSYKWPERSPHLVAVMRCVRFGLLSPLFLRYLQGEHGTRVMHCIGKCAEVQEMIKKAFVYVTSELFFKDPTKSLPFQLPEYDVPVQRRWIYDRQCLYHRDLNSTQRQLISYTQFLEYLESLHQTGPEYWNRLVYLTEPLAAGGSRQTKL